ncbi:hypothetical protein [Bradyrhizobium sp.]|uniref:hypothetical protein n=1 Tax=Bradyrhizobium sp. TaxID=376 RepID=UPI003C5C10F4
MRAKLAVVTSITLLAASGSHADDNKACISKAAEALPHIAGLVIKKTHTRPVPASILSTWQGQTRPIMVDVDTVLGDEQQTYSYMCVLTKGAPYVRRVMS